MLFSQENRPRNKVAQQLSDGRYHQRVVKNRKPMTEKSIRWTAEIVSGKCPSCDVLHH